MPNKCNNYKHSASRIHLQTWDSLKKDLKFISNQNKEQTSPLKQRSSTKQYIPRLYINLEDKRHHEKRHTRLREIPEWGGECWTPWSGSTALGKWLASKGLKEKVSSLWGNSMLVIVLNTVSLGSSKNKGLECQEQESVISTFPNSWWRSLGSQWRTARTCSVDRTHRFRSVLEFAFEQVCLFPLLHFIFLNWTF